MGEEEGQEKVIRDKYDQNKTHTHYILYEWNFLYFIMKSMTKYN